MQWGWEGAWTRPLMFLWKLLLRLPTRLLGLLRRLPWKLHGLLRRLVGRLLRRLGEKGALAAKVQHEKVSSRTVGYAERYKGKW